MAESEREDSTPQIDTLGPVTRLPREVLSDIFILLRDSCPNRSWLLILRICHQWRSTAIGCPLLWTIIPDTKSRTLRLFMVKRSKKAPLVFRCLRPCRKPRSIEINRIVNDNLYRIRELGLVFDAEQEWTENQVNQWVAKILSPGAAPALDRLEITSNSPTDFWVSLPSVTLGISTLVINGCHVKFPDSIVTEAQSDLTFYKIMMPLSLTLNDSQPLYNSALFDRMSNLTQLHINSTRAYARFIFPKQARRILLVHLQMLRFSGHSTHCVELLSLLDLSPSTKIHLRITDAQVLPERSISLHQSLSEVFQRRTKTGLDTDSATGSSTYDVWFSVMSRSIINKSFYTHITVFESTALASNANHWHDTMQAQAQPILALRFGSHLNRSKVQLDCFTDFLQYTIPPQSRISLRLQSILSFTGEDSLADSSNESFDCIPSRLRFLACPKVRQVYTGEVDACFVASFMVLRERDTLSTGTTKCSKSQPTDSGFIVFPNLETLILTSSDSWHSRGATTMGDLHAGLEARRAAGQEVKLTSTRSDDSWRKFIGEDIWRDHD